MSPLTGRKVIHEMVGSGGARGHLVAAGMRRGAQVPTPAGSGSLDMENGRPLARGRTEGRHSQGGVVGDFPRRRAQPLRAAITGSEPVTRGRAESPGSGSFIGPSRFL